MDIVICINTRNETRQYGLPPDQRSINQIDYVQTKVTLWRWKPRSQNLVQKKFKMWATWTEESKSCREEEIRERKFDSLNLKECWMRTKIYINKGNNIHIGEVSRKKNVNKKGTKSY